MQGARERKGRSCRRSKRDAGSGQGGSAAGRDYIVRRNAKGRKKFLTCLRYMRTQEFPLLHKSFRSGKADTTYPLSHPVLSISPSCPTSYPPFKRPVASPLPTTFTAAARWGVARCLPLSRGARALLSFDGESERSHVPWRALPRRLTRTPNHNFNAYAYARTLYE